MVISAAITGGIQLIQLVSGIIAKRNAGEITEEQALAGLADAQQNVKDAFSNYKSAGQ